MLGSRSHKEPVAVVADLVAVVADLVAAADSVAAADCALDTVAVVVPHDHSNSLHLHFVGRHGYYYCNSRAAAVVDNFYLDYYYFHIVDDDCYCYPVAPASEAEVLRVAVEAIRRFEVAEAVEEGCW